MTAPAPTPGPEPRRRATGRAAPPTPLDSADDGPGTTAGAPHGARPSATPAPDRLAAVVQQLRGVLAEPAAPGVDLGNWRWRLRRRVSDVRDALAVEAALSGDPWAAAVGGDLLQERTTLMMRLAEAGALALTEADVPRLRRDLGLLVEDIHEHVGRARAWAGRRGASGQDGADRS